MKLSVLALDYDGTFTRRPSKCIRARCRGGRASAQGHGDPGDRADPGQLAPRCRGFSRWIGDVFGDHALARELEGYEQEYPKEKYRQALERIVAAINSRYELTDATNVEVVHSIESAVT